MPSNEREPTRAGHILGTISILVILASSVPIVTWRDAAGHALPTVAAIGTAMLVGVAFFVISAGILRLFGIRVSEPQTESTKPKDQ